MLYRLGCGSGAKQPGVSGTDGGEFRVFLALDAGTAFPQLPAAKTPVPSFQAVPNYLLGFVPPPA